MDVTNVIDMTTVTLDLQPNYELYSLPFYIHVISINQLLFTIEIILAHVLRTKSMNEIIIIFIIETNFFFLSRGVMP